MSTAPASPIKTTVSANFNHHRAVRQGPGVLLLQPVRNRALLWTGLRLLVLSPLIYFALRHFSTDRQLQLWGALLPVMGGLPLIIFSLLAGAVGMTARFDRERGELVLTGLRFGKGETYALSDIREVQLCSAGMKGGGEGGAWEGFQLNLRLEPAGQVVHINLLENAAEADLRDMGCSISEFLGIPFNDAAGLNMAFRQEAYKVGRLLGRRVVSIFLFLLAGFCLLVGGVLWLSEDVPRWAPVTLGVAAAGIVIFTWVWAFSWRLSTFRCPQCGGPVKTKRGATRETLLVCEQCGQSASTGISR